VSKSERRRSPTKRSASSYRSSKRRQR
jgi:hypothetical protein